jgi:cyclopropane-fatty-acyl-phospholipid synthase
MNSAHAGEWFRSRRSGSSDTGRTRARSSSRSTSADRWLLRRIREAVQPARLRFVLWDGFALPAEPGSEVATLVIHTRRALVSWAWDAELHFGEAYMRGEVAVHGDLVGMLEEVYQAQRALRVRARWWTPTNDLSAARANVHHHYDLGDAFYRLWLDPELVYTCAYFPTPASTLEEAQAAKMRLVCQKLRLQPGERVIEAGCGWGALALFMARHYGVRVRAFNVSTEQIGFARDRATREQLAHLVEFIEDDYREVRGQSEVFVSIGMLEHVGKPEYPALGRVIDRALTPEGRGLLHFIGRNRPAPLNPWICRRIFPGAYAPTLREVCEGVLEPQGMSVLDVENLRQHYRATLRHWRHRFDASADVVERMFDEPFVRAWRLYLAGSEAAFGTGWMQLFQVVFARGASNAIPWRRDEPVHPFGAAAPKPWTGATS